MSLLQTQPATRTSLIDLVGNTPLLRLARVAQLPPGVELYAKAEWHNPGGSVKDRPALAMIRAGEASGLLRPGVRIADATSGNTGIAYATLGAALGYAVTLALPGNASPERKRILRALGAELILTDPMEGTDGAIRTIRALVAEQPDRFFYPDQYNNPANPQAHYDTTGPEIVEQMDGKLDYAVISIGTGGALTGIARYLREAVPLCKIVAVDPIGSIMGGGDIQAPYLVEGIGYDFIPDTYDPQLVDQVVKTADKESFLTARRLIREEGLLVGGSSGAVMWSAMEIAKTAPAGSRIMVVLADSIRNYMSKFLLDSWMREKGFLD